MSVSLSKLKDILGEVAGILRVRQLFMCPVSLKCGCDEFCYSVRRSGGVVMAS